MHVYKNADAVTTIVSWTIGRYSILDDWTIQSLGRLDNKVSWTIGRHSLLDDWTIQSLGRLDDIVCWTIGRYSLLDDSSHRTGTYNYCVYKCINLLALNNLAQSPTECYFIQQLANPLLHIFNSQSISLRSLIH